MTPRRRSELYRLAVGLAAVAVCAIDLSGHPAGHIDLWLAGSLAVAGILALEFPMHINLSHKLSVGTAVFFAAVLLLPAWAAALLVAGVQAVDLWIQALRRVAATHERPPIGTIGLGVLFNAGQAYIAALAAGLILQAGGVSAGSGLSTPLQGLVLVAAAAVMYVVNLLLVSIAIGMATSRNPLQLFLHTQRIVYVQYASLYVLGGLAAFAAVKLAWLPLLAIVPAVLVYHSLRQRVEVGRDAMRAMERMADEVDRRDPYTFNHSQRVAIYSHAIARKLALNEVEIEQLELAAKVHDIGKIRIPDSILLKPAKLTDAERHVMETHPRLGFDILKPFNEYSRVLELVLSHHERYDGKGYPNGTVGRHTPLLAQVIPVADSLDAMTTERAYRGARSWDSALEELRRGAGTQWNPHVVRAAVAVLTPKASQAQTPRPALRQARGSPAAT